MLLTFDRGTLLLRDVPAGVDATGICGLRWDARVSAWRAPAHRYAELSGRLARGKIAASDQVRAVTAPAGAWSPIDLRPYQDEALLAWEMAGRRGTIVLPTGSGKTRVALAAMARSGLATMCLVPTRVLLEQWLDALGRVYRDRVGCFGDGVHELAPISVATHESAYRYMHRIGNRFELLVIDEAHHFGNGIRDEALEMAIAPARLGLTATPVREGPAVDRLQALIGPLVCERSISDLAGTFWPPSMP
jgi:superfamily II DNA or RNA helicase